MNTQRLVRIAFLAAILIISKEMLALLPNVELVSLLVIVYSLTFSERDNYLIVIVFVLTQCALYGVGDWVLGYLISWPLLIFGCTRLSQKLDSALKVALLSGAFGLIFGVFFVLPYLMVSPQVALAYYIKGLIFDVIHGVSNFIIALFLFDPIYKLMKKISL